MSSKQKLKNPLKEREPTITEYVASTTLIPPKIHSVAKILMPPKRSRKISVPYTPKKIVDPKGSEPELEHIYLPPRMPPSELRSEYTYIPRRPPSSEGDISEFRPNIEKIKITPLRRSDDMDYVYDYDTELDFINEYYFSRVAYIQYEKNKTYTIVENIDDGYIVRIMNNCIIIEFNQKFRDSNKSYTSLKKLLKQKQDIANQIIDGFLLRSTISFNNLNVGLTYKGAIHDDFPLKTDSKDWVTQPYFIYLDINMQKYKDSKLNILSEIDDWFFDLTNLPATNPSFITYKEPGEPTEVYSSQTRKTEKKKIFESRQELQEFVKELKTFGPTNLLQFTQNLSQTEKNELMNLFKEDPTLLSQFKSSVGKLLISGLLNPSTYKEVRDFASPSLGAKVKIDQTKKEIPKDIDRTIVKTNKIKYKF